jgi:hypothetical protein
MRFIPQSSRWYALLRALHSASCIHFDQSCITYPLRCSSRDQRFRMCTGQAIRLPAHTDLANIIECCFLPSETDLHQILFHASPRETLLRFGVVIVVVVVVVIVTPPACDRAFRSFTSAPPIIDPVAPRVRGSDEIQGELKREAQPGLRSPLVSEEHSSSAPEPSR